MLVSLTKSVIGQTLNICWLNNFLRASLTAVSLGFICFSVLLMMVKKFFRFLSVVGHLTPIMNRQFDFGWLRIKPVHSLFEYLRKASHVFIRWFGITVFPLRNSLFCRFWHPFGQFTQRPAHPLSGRFQTAWIEGFHGLSNICKTVLNSSSVSGTMKLKIAWYSISVDSF